MPVLKEVPIQAAQQHAQVAGRVLGVFVAIRTRSACPVRSACLPELNPSTCSRLPSGALAESHCRLSQKLPTGVDQRSFRPRLLRAYSLWQRQQSSRQHSQYGDQPAGRFFRETLASRALRSGGRWVSLPTLLERIATPVATMSWSKRGFARIDGSPLFLIQGSESHDAGREQSPLESDRV